MGQTPDWEGLKAAKRQQRDSRIPAAWTLSAEITSQAHRGSTASAFDLLAQTDLLSQREQEITENYDATALLEFLATGAISSLEVTTAFCKRAAIAQQLVGPFQRFKTNIEPQGADHDLDKLPHRNFLR